MIAVFLFYGKSHGMPSWLTFNKELKHCNVITFDGKAYILTRLTQDGICIRKLDIDSLEEYIDKLKERVPDLNAVVSVWIEERKDRRWFPLMINSCNELARKVSGIDLGPTFNSAHLYHNLLVLEPKRDFQIDYAWRRSVRLEGETSNG